MIGDNRPIVIDVGINRNEEGKLCGDCDYANLIDVCEYVSPVPGGVGLLTRLALMSNVIKAVKEN
jgi:methylenetetrahydrofolate dehydrogenase (NADP+)/methenyltetrahydrofolate cyclohydrolase